MAEHTNLNIVQGAFPHLRGLSSPDALTKEYRERIKDGCPITTVVRFFDEDSVMTNFLLLLCRVEREKAALFRAAAINLSNDWQPLGHHNQLADKLDVLRKKGRALTIQQLDWSMRTSQQVAVTDGSRFRDVCKDERHELLEAVRWPGGFALSVFTPNGLLAEKQTLLLSG